MHHVWIAAGDSETLIDAACGRVAVRMTWQDENGEQAGPPVDWFCGACGDLIASEVAGRFVVPASNVTRHDDE